jgi:putative transposase
MPSFDYVGGYAYHIVFSTKNHLPRFRNASVVGSCAEELLASAAKHDFEVLAYCFMPHHAHILVCGAESSSLVRFVQHFKQATGYRHRNLWQRSYYDHVVRNEEAIDEIARYIWDNPIVAGLAEHPADYAYSGPREAFEAYAGGPVDTIAEDRAKALSLQDARSLIR